MTTKTLDQILQIYENMRCSEETRSIWEAYEQSHNALYAWMDTLSDEDWDRIDDAFHCFYAVHFAMMELALNQQK